MNRRPQNSLLKSSMSVRVVEGVSSSYGKRVKSSLGTPRHSVCDDRRQPTLTGPVSKQAWSSPKLRCATRRMPQRGCGDPRRRCCMHCGCTRYGRGCGCSDQSASPLPPVAKPDSTRWWLRVANIGSRPIGNLVGVFPGERVSSGDVGVGEVSAYRPVPNGVFPSAACHYSRDGEATRQGIPDAT
jgi:hypothetical protein